MERLPWIDDSISCSIISPPTDIPGSSGGVSRKRLGELFVVIAVPLIVLFAIASFGAMFARGAW